MIVIVMKIAKPNKIATVLGTITTATATKIAMIVEKTIDSIANRKTSNAKNALES
jgi:hypothetical protein